VRGFAILPGFKPLDIITPSPIDHLEIYLDFI
jgi:hypothetical protein